MFWNDFASFAVNTGGGMLSGKVGGSGPPLVLLHGFPQTHLMWEKVAPALATGRKVICFDLPGYGRSDPPSDVDAASKRAMGSQIIEAMACLGHDSFAIAGHDRGGRVAYRIALDHPERVTQLAILDILPTIEYWDRVNHAFAMRIYHWMFLAQPEPLPERLIGGASDFYIDHTLKSWTASQDLSAFTPEALEMYRSQARDSRRLKAMCDDYRAGESVDVSHDEADRGVRKIQCETLVLWGSVGIAGNAATPLDTWKEWCVNVRGEAIESGHFLPEENPAATLNSLQKFFLPVPPSEPQGVTESV